ncbi:MAG: methyltransferase domain-containing protein [Tissierellia bacterium]|nr:methyltransferase domain-containing protein [Tissierellia bacterium]
MVTYTNLETYNSGFKDFALETTSIWSFPNRGSWANHNGKYRGNWSPYVPRNLILRYSKNQDIVLDQFVGGGTTLMEAALLGRRGIGIDINPDAIKISSKNISELNMKKGMLNLRTGDARNLNFIKDNSIDLICTHPPYADIIKYSENIKGDLSNYCLDDFLIHMQDVAGESYRVLKKGKICAIMIGDTRKNKNIKPLGFQTMEVFLKAGFTLKEIIIKHQHNCEMTRYWKEKSAQYNFFLIAHEYLFIFEKS